MLFTAVFKSPHPLTDSNNFFKHNFYQFVNISTVQKYNFSLAAVTSGLKIQPFPLILL